jgi:nucleoside-diphosphate-sugar epimerase
LDPAHVVKILVSGATGFVASHLVPALVTAGHDVIAAGHERSRVPSDGTPLEFDLARGEWPALPEVDALVHLAQANVPFPDGADALFAVNVAATQRLLEHVRRTGGRVFILASSGSVYGPSGAPLTEDSPLAARDFYSATKVAAERLACAYEQHLQVAVLRLFVPYGPGQVRRMLPRLIERIASRQSVQLNRDGRPRMNPVYIDDVVRVVLRALDGELRSGTVLNVAGDDVTDVRAVSELIGEIVQIEPSFEESNADVPDIVADNTRLHQFLGDVSLVPLRDGLERTVRSGW